MKVTYPIIKIPKAFLDLKDDTPPLPMRPIKLTIRGAKGSNIFNAIIICLKILLIPYLLLLFGSMLDQKELNEAFYLFTFLTGFVGSTIYFIINYFNSIIIRKQITKHNIIASEEYDLETKKYKLECERIMHRDNVKKYRKSKLTKIKSLDPRDNYFDNRTIGISEKSFFDYLKKIYPLEIKKNIFVGDFEKPFQCDLAFIKDNIRINIEIDEPYESQYGYPIHVREVDEETRDDFRDQYFLDSNWFVLRFTEHQVVKRPNDCVKLIERILLYLESLNGRFIPFIYLSGLIISENSWNYNEAVLLKEKKYRESYLGLVFKYKIDRTKDPAIEIDTMTVGKLKLIGNSLAFFEFDYKDNIYKTTSFEYSEKQIEFACIKFASEYPIKNEVYLFGTDKKTFEWRANNLGYNPYYNKIYYSKEFCYQD